MKNKEETEEDIDKILNMNYGMRESVEYHYFLEKYYEALALEERHICIDIISRLFQEPERVPHVGDICYFLANRNLIQFKRQVFIVAEQKLICKESYLNYDIILLMKALISYELALFERVSESFIKGMSMWRSDTLGGFCSEVYGDIGTLHGRDVHLATVKRALNTPDLSKEVYAALSNYIKIRRLE